MTEKDVSDIVTEIWKRLAKMLFWMVNKARKLNIVLHFEGGYSVGGEQMALTLSVVQQAKLSISAVDAKGNPAPVENVVYETSDPQIILVGVDPNDETKAVVAARNIGTGQVTVTADADIGEGTKELMGLLDVEVVAAEAVALAIEAGVPEDQPALPPPTTITEPPHVEPPIVGGVPYPIPHGKKKK